MSEKIILVVEDNPDDEILMLRTIRKNNIANEVVIAHDGVEALDYLFGTGKFTERDLGIMPQLIILDLKLPKISGLEVLEKLRSSETTKLIPVVVLTTSTEQQDVIKNSNLGTNGYVQKPIDFNKFIEATRQLGLFWLLLNKTPFAL